MTASRNQDFGNPPIPVHVTFIDEDQVHLGGDTAPLASAVPGSRFRDQAVFSPPKRGKWLVAMRIPGGYRLENPEFIELFLWLNEQGVRFGYDYKQGMDPEGLMTTLQERGMLTEPFRNIYWRGTDTWYSDKIRPGRKADHD